MFGTYGQWRIGKTLSTFFCRLRWYWWGLLPAGVQVGGGGEAHWTPRLLSWIFRCCKSGVHFLVSFTNVDLQAVFRFEVVLTLVTLENIFFRFSLLFRSCFHRRRFSLRWRTMLLGQKLCSPPGISSLSWWTLPLLRQGWRAISREAWCPRKMWRSGQLEGEAEGLSLAGQRLAERHPLHWEAKSEFSSLILRAAIFNYIWIRNFPWRAKRKYMLLLSITFSLLGEKRAKTFGQGPPLTRAMPNSRTALNEGG